MKTIQILRQGKELELPIVFSKQPSSNEILRENIGTIYAPALEVLFNPDVEILRDDIFLWNDYQLEVKAINEIQYQGKVYLKKVMVGK